MSTTNRQGARRGRASGGWNPGQMVFLGLFVAGMLFALPTMLVLTLGLLPALVAFVVDLHPRKYAARCVGFLNFAGTLPFLVKLWSGQHDLMSAMKILTDVYAWFVIYSAAAVGWLIFLGMPNVSGFIMEIHAARRIRKLEAERKNLIKEWGEEIDRTRRES